MEVTLDNIESLNIKKIKHNRSLYFVKYHKEYARIEFASRINNFEVKSNEFTGWSYNEAIRNGYLKNIIECDKKKPELILW